MAQEREDGLTVRAQYTNEKEKEDREEISREHRKESVINLSLLPSAI